MFTQGFTVEIEPNRLHIGHNAQPPHLADTVKRHKVAVRNTGSLFLNRQFPVNTLVSGHEIVKGPIADTMGRDLQIVFDDRAGNAVESIRIYEQ